MFPDPPSGRAGWGRARWRFRLEWLAVGLLASVGALLAAAAPLANPLDRAAYDQLIRLSPRRPSDRILLVAIDDQSLASLGGWPWSRARHAALLDRLTAAGAGAVAFDVLFLEPDPNGGDNLLASALARSGRTVLPVLQLSPGENGRLVQTAPPLPALAAHAAALGQVNIAPDADGVVRAVSGRVAIDGACWPQLSLAALRLADGAGPDAACAALAAASTHTPGLIGSRSELVPFAGRPGRFRTVSAAAVVRGEVPQAFIQGKIVLVGATAAGLGDRYPTASTGKNGGLTGVELQANLLDAATAGVRIRLASFLVVGAGSVGAVWLLLVLLTRLKPRAGPWAAAGLLATAGAATIIAFHFGWWVSPFPAAAGLILAYPLWSWRRLALASDALGQEIDRFDARETPAVAGADPLARQMDNLSFAAERLRALHRMLAETLQSLPDATVAVDAAGLIRLANARALARAGGVSPVGADLKGWLAAALGERAGREAHSALMLGAAGAEVSASDGADFEVRAAEVAGLAEPASWRIIRLVDVTAIRRAVRQREDALQLLTHDIRAPFASISALIRQPDPDGLRLVKIEGYASRGRALAESYVQWSRAENAEMALEPFDLRDALIDAADELWAVARQVGVDLASEVPEEEVLVLGERSLMTRAIINLIDNAVRFSPRGQTVEAVCFTDGDDAVCEVRDRGPGVDPALQGRLFQRFTRSDRNQTGSGAGLGLAIAALAVERIGGAAAYESRPEGGSIFRLSTPQLREG